MEAPNAGMNRIIGRATALSVFLGMAFFGMALSGCATVESTFDAINPFGGEAPEEAPTKPAPRTKSLEEAAKAAQESARPTTAETAVTEPAVAGSPAEIPSPLKPSAISAPERVQPVEVMWRVPTDPVEKYYILYGTDEAKLDKQVELAVKDIQKIDHPKFGPVFRYELKQIPSDKTLFISLKAENRFGVSAPTPPVRLEPGKRTVTP